MSGPTTEEQIGEELLRIHRSTHGTGAERATVHVLDEAVVVFLEDIQLLPNEEWLVSQGREDVVLDMRREYQSAVATPFKAAVERMTGRRVTHFTSDTSLEPLFSVEIFRLA